MLEEVGAWLINTFISLWKAFSEWGYIGFAIIMFPILRKVVRFLRSFTV